MVCQSPVGVTHLRKFSTSNGCQDHTTLPSANSVCRPHAVYRSRGLSRPAITLRARRCRVHRIPSRVRDDRDTPLMRDRTAGDIEVIWVNRETEYFYKWGWTGFTDLPVRQSAPPLLELRRTQAEGVTRILIVGALRMALLRPPHYV